MSDDQFSRLLTEFQSLRAELDSLRADLAARQAVPAAPAIRIEPYTVGEFAKLIRRSEEYVSDRCRARVIKTLPGKPYRIPVSEEKRWAGIDRAA